MIAYASIKIYTNETAQYEGQPLSTAIIGVVRSLRLAARTLVTRSFAGSYENGELATNRLVNASYDLPLVIEIVLPQAETQTILDVLNPMVADGLVTIEPLQLVAARTPSRVLLPNWLVKDVMTMHPKTGEIGMPLADAVKLLQDTALKCLPVVSPQNIPVGIVTQQDLIKRAGMPIRLSLLKDLSRVEQVAWASHVATLGLQDVMTRSPITVDRDATLDFAIKLMVQHDLKRLLVTGSDGELVGMLSRIDVFKVLSPAFMVKRADQDVDLSKGGVMQQVSDLQQRDRLSVSEDECIETAIELLANEEVQRAAVVDEQLHLVGVITDARLLSAIDRIDSKGIFSFKRKEIPRVSDIMIKELVRVTEGDSLSTVLDLMIQNGLKRIPVVDAQGRFTGMIRRDSLLLALSKHL
ncbi:DUF190 domain-containing protein [Sphaerochaeta sp.]|uniref:DUF190 domain-containing protein n=1 Tax=Sphaerochaeta sp. TaxID=1972642 RepID=UPI002FC8AF3C